MANNTIIKDFVINNLQGLHARPATMFVQAALPFSSDIQVLNLSTNAEADGKSVMSMLMLAAPKGTQIRVTVTGPDAEEAMNVLSSLILGGFGDD